MKIGLDGRVIPCHFLFKVKGREIIRALSQLN